MNWIKVTNPRLEVPRDESAFLAIWKGRICIAQFSEDEWCYFISWFPAEIPSTVNLNQHDEARFEYWMPLPEWPEEYKLLSKSYTKGVLPEKPK